MLSSSREAPKERDGFGLRQKLVRSLSNMGMKREDRPEDELDMMLKKKFSQDRQQAAARTTGVPVFFQPPDDDDDDDDDEESHHEHSSEDGTVKSAISARSHRSKKQLTTNRSPTGNSTRHGKRREKNKCLSPRQQSSRMRPSLMTDFAEKYQASYAPEPHRKASSRDLSSSQHQPRRTKSNDFVDMPMQGRSKLESKELPRRSRSNDLADPLAGLGGGSLHGSRPVSTKPARSPRGRKRAEAGMKSKRALSSDPLSASFHGWPTEASALDSSLHGGFAAADDSFHGGLSLSLDDHTPATDRSCHGRVPLSASFSLYGGGSPPTPSNEYMPTKYKSPAGGRDRKNMENGGGGRAMRRASSSHQMVRSESFSRRSNKESSRNVAAQAAPPTPLLARNASNKSHARRLGAKPEGQFDGIMKAPRDGGGGPGGRPPRKSGRRPTRRNSMQ